MKAFENVQSAIAKYGETPLFLPGSGIIESNPVVMGSCEEIERELTPAEVIADLRAQIEEKNAMIRQQQTTLDSYGETAKMNRGTIDGLWAENATLQEALKGANGPLGEFMAKVLGEAFGVVHIDVVAEAKQLAPGIVREHAKQELKSIVLPKMVEQEIARLDTPAERALAKVQITRDPETQALVAEAAKQGHDTQMAQVAADHRDKLIKEAREKPLDNIEVVGARIGARKDLQVSGELEQLRQKKKAEYIEAHHDEILGQLFEHPGISLGPVTENVARYFSKQTNPVLLRRASVAVYEKFAKMAGDIANANGTALGLHGKGYDDLAYSSCMINEMIRGLQVEYANHLLQQGLLTPPNLPAGIQLEFKGRVAGTQDVDIQLLLTKHHDPSFLINEINFLNKFDIRKLGRKNLVKAMQERVDCGIQRELHGFYRHKPSGAWQDTDNLSHMKRLALGKVGRDGTVDADRTKATDHEVLIVQSVRCL